MDWTFQVRFPPNGENAASEWRWHTSAKHYKGVEHAAAGAAQLQAVAADNGILLESRLTPVKLTDTRNETPQAE